MPTTEIFRRHLDALDGFLADALERAGRAGLALEGVLFHAGRVRTYHRDDEHPPFRPDAHYRRWAPLWGPEHALLARPGERPLLVVVRPRDYWFDTSPPPPSFWEAAVRIEVVERPADLSRALGSVDRVAFVGSAREVAAELGIDDELVEPEALMAPLDWHRATKTEYEARAIEEAAGRVAAGFRAALERRDAGGTEREVFHAYLAGADLEPHEIAFSPIVALDAKGSVLHYQHKRSTAGDGRSLLLDAGAFAHGYAADVTRTWPGPDADPEFRRLVADLDGRQRELVAGVRAGASFVDLHLEAHRHVAEALAAVGVVRDAPEALDRGITRAFFPHGLGHHLGLQVHDVGGHQASPEGGTEPPPAEHPFLRTTRTVEPGHVVTIEPGVYFIPMLLDPLRDSPEADAVDWAVVERLLPHGGVRIEDDVLCTDGEPRDLTRGHVG